VRRRPGRRTATTCWPRLFTSVEGIFNPDLHLKQKKDSQFGIKEDLEAFSEAAMTTTSPPSIWPRGR
jgi:hypothetical protein